MYYKGQKLALLLYHKFLIKKITMKKVFFLAMFLCVGVVSMAQNSIKEGKIVYSAEWEAGEGMPAEMAEAFPKELTTYFKGGKSYSGMSMDMMGQKIQMNVVTESAPMKMVMLMDMMGQKIGITSDASDMAKIQEDMQVMYEYLDFKKNIAGYTCQKVIVSIGSTGQTMEMYVTEELALPMSQYTVALKGLKGTPLEFTQVQNGMTVRMVAKQVVAEPVQDAIFELPSGYNMMTMKEAAAMGLQN